MITVFVGIVALIVVIDLLITLRQIKDTLQRIERLMRGEMKKAVARGLRKAKV